ncbi:MAG: hypothetical protein KDC80_23985 [Saprospiraceae bacterium]|nr:hypothetical protein [Saprospiraceae bacterium]
MVAFDNAGSWFLPFYGSQTLYTGGRNHLADGSLLAFSDHRSLDVRDSVW